MHRLARSFYTSASRAFPRQPPARANDVEIPLALQDAAAAEGITTDDFREVQPGIRAQWSLDDIVDSENDTTSAGHIYLLQQQQNLRYLRLIEHEMPKLVGESTLDASVDRLTCHISLSQAIRPSNVGNAPGCPVLILWRGSASRHREACCHSRRVSASA
jgi:hypothetical protein